MTKPNWRKVAWVGFLGATLAGACTVNEGDGVDDEDDGGATTGGSTGKGGTGGTAGKGGTGGTTTGSGGTNAAGGAEDGGSTGTGTGGTGGTGTVDTKPAECETGAGGEDPVGTAGDDCAVGTDDDVCYSCIKESCCEAWNNCIGYEPYNVCGWGGPENGGEFNCYLTCMQGKYVEDDAVTDMAKEECATQCATPGDANVSGMDCGQIGDETNALIACLHDFASNDCEIDCIGE